MTQETGFADTVAALQELLAQDELNATFRAQELHRIRQAAQFMRDQVESGMKGEEVSPSKDQVKQAKDAVQSLLVAFLTRPLPELQLFEVYALLAYNWSQLAQSETVGNAAEALNNLVQNHNSVVFFTEVARQLGRYLEQTLTHQPPVYELSQHYLTQLQASMTTGGD